MIHTDGKPTIAWSKPPETADHEEPRNPWAETRSPGHSVHRKRRRLISKASRRRNR